MTEISSHQRENQDQAAAELDLNSMSPRQYAAFRSKYVKEGGGTPPPGATPSDPDQ